MESGIGWWIPHTKGQWRGKRFRFIPASYHHCCCSSRVLPRLRRAISSVSWAITMRYLCVILLRPVSRTGFWLWHYSGVIMGAIVSQMTSLMIVYSIVYSSADQRKHQSSVSLAFVQGIHRWPVNSPHKWPVTRRMFPFDDVIMITSSAPERIRWNIRKLVIFKPIFIINNSCEIALRRLTLDLTDDKPTLVQVVAWCLHPTNDYLSQYWPRCMSPHDITRPQCVNGTLTN